MGTAGLLRVAVSGDNLVPAPPPKIMAITFLFMVVTISVKKQMNSKLFVGCYHFIF